jgi:cysteinyl-tRNA synthetase
MFLEEKEKYSAWDERGIPTLDKEGKPLKDKFRKKLEKQFE